MNHECRANIITGAQPSGKPKRPRRAYERAIWRHAMFVANNVGMFATVLTCRQPRHATRRLTLRAWNAIIDGMTDKRKKKTKNELKAELIHGFINRTNGDIPTRGDRYQYSLTSESILQDCRGQMNSLLAATRIPNIISEDGLKSLFAMYDKVVSDIDALETGETPELIRYRKAELLYYMYSFLMEMRKSYPGISRILRAAEPIGVFVAYMASYADKDPTINYAESSMRDSIDALEIHVGDIPNMDSASFVIRGLLTYNVDFNARYRYDFKGISNKTLWVSRKFNADYDDNGMIVRHECSRMFNPRIFIDLCYRDIDAILAKYPSLFCNCSKYAYEDMMAEPERNNKRRQMDESLVNDTNSIIWSRAISLDDLLACMDDVNEGIDENGLLAIEDLLSDKSMAFHRIMDSMRTDADIDEKAYDDVMDSLQVLRDGCPDGIIHFTMSDLSSLMYASIAFDRQDMAGIYASLMMFLKSYDNDASGETKGLKKTITMNAGNMSREFLHNVRELPYEFVKETFTLTQQSLNNVSSRLEG